MDKFPVFDFSDSDFKMLYSDFNFSRSSDFRSRINCFTERKCQLGIMEDLWVPLKPEFYLHGGRFFRLLSADVLFHQATELKY